jgi:hypothetical protein
MAQTKDWLPQEAAKLEIFADNYVEEIDDATVLANLPKDTFKVSKDATQTWLDTLKLVNDAEKEATRLRKLLDEQNQQMETALRAAVKQIKGTIDIPVQVLTMLELVNGSNDAQAKVAAQAPALIMSVELGVVKGRYTKYGHQGVNVYSCRTGEKEFTLLGRFNMSRFEDTRPNLVAGQPEQRDYYAVFVDKDKEVGNQSATVSVVVGSRPGA